VPTRPSGTRWPAPTWPSAERGMQPGQPEAHQAQVLASHPWATRRTARSARRMRAASGNAGAASASCACASKDPASPRLTARSWSSAIKPEGCRRNREVGPVSCQPGPNGPPPMDGKLQYLSPAALPLPGLAFERVHCPALCPACIALLLARRALPCFLPGVHSAARDSEWPHASEPHAGCSTLVGAEG